MVGDLLLTFSAFSESVWFSFLSRFLVSVPWLLSFLFSFLTEAMLRKKSHWRYLEKLYSWTNIPVSFLPFCHSLCCFFLTFIPFLYPSCLFPFSCFLYPASLFFLFFPALFLISSHFCVPLLSIFYFHISRPFWNAVLLLCWLVILLSIVPFNAILAMFGSKRSAGFSSYFFIQQWFSLCFHFLLSGVFSCTFWSVSSLQCLSVGTVFVEESGCHVPCLSIPPVSSRSLEYILFLLVSS